MRNTTELFGHRDYTLLWITLLAGGIGSWLRILGTAQWLLDDTDSAWLVGAIGLVQLVVQTPTLLWAGTLADRVDRKRLITIANGLTAASLLALGILHLTGQLTPVWVYLGIALTAMSQVLANPARAALVPMVVPERLLLPAASMDTASHNAAAIIGPLSFAAIATAFGLDAVFLVGGGMFVVASLMPLMVRVSGHAEGHAANAPQSTWRQTREGLGYVAKHPILPGLFLLDGGITVVSFYRDILPVLALGLFAGGATATGLLGAANSLGALVGSFAALFFIGYKAKGMLVLYASIIYAVFLLGFGLANSLWIGLVMIALLGGADAVTVAVRNTTVMLTTPDHMRGRAFSLMYLAASSANNIGTLWVGFWAGVIGAVDTLLLGAVLAILATAAIGVWWQPIRMFRSDE
jgi:MFS family permease